MPTITAPVSPSENEGTLRAAKIAGIRAMLVRAISADAARFYTRRTWGFGFAPRVLVGQTAFY